MSQEPGGTGRPVAENEPVPGRADVLAAYRQWLADRWRDGHLSLDEVRALQIFCEVHTLTADEHEAIVNEVGVDRSELVDEHNQRVADWLRARRQPPPAGSGALRFAPVAGAPPWKRRLPAPPRAWQTAIAALAALVMAGALIVAIIAR